MPAKPRSHVQRLTPYIPGKPVTEVQRELCLEHVVKLASNENPLGPSPAAIAAIHEGASSAHIYPDAASFELRAALARKHQISPDLIMVGSGSDELIHYLSLIFLDPGDEIIMGDPGFSRYSAGADLAQAKTVLVPLDENERHDLPAMAAAITDNTKLIWIANPNNPTGTIIRRREFEEFLDHLPDTVAVVLDEAYFEFAIDPEYPNALDYIRQGRQVIGLRTFSKTYGLAGLRVGYGFASGEIVKVVDGAREPFNVTSIAQKAAVAALADEDHLQRTIRANQAGLARLTGIFESCGVKTVESFTNFVWADLGRSANQVCSELLGKGIIIRSGALFGRPTCVRVSIGSPAEIDAFQAAFRDTVRA
ncbi:MAG: histidinol-phosphate transaminase [Fimbriimonadales bacterium]